MGPGNGSRPRLPEKRARTRYLVITMARQRAQGSAPFWRDALRRVRLVTATTERGPPTLHKPPTDAFQLASWIVTSRHGHNPDLRRCTDWRKFGCSDLPIPICGTRAPGRRAGLARDARASSSVRWHFKGISGRLYALSVHVPGQRCTSWSVGSWQSSRRRCSAAPSTMGRFASLTCRNVNVGW